MNGCCKEVIEPSIKLGRMVTLSKILACFHFILILVDLFIVDTGIFFLMFIQFIILLVGISTKSFSHYLLFILNCFVNIFIIFQALGTWFQIGFYKNDNSIVFSFFVFLFVFEIFCIYVIFQSYKQSKQEYREKYGFAEEGNGANGGEGNIQIDNGNNNNNNGNFVPFQGNGVVVGGN